MTSRDALLLACQQMARAASARPLEPLPEVEHAVLDVARKPDHLLAVVQAQPRRRREVALADAFAIGRAHGLTASRTNAVLTALIHGAPDRPDGASQTERDLRRLREACWNGASVLDAVAALVEQARR